MDNTYQILIQIPMLLPSQKINIHVYPSLLILVVYHRNKVSDRRLSVLLLCCEIFLVSGERKIVPVPHAFNTHSSCNGKVSAGPLRARLGPGEGRSRGPVTQKLYRVKIVPGGTFLVTKFVPPRYTFGRQKCTGLAKSVPPRYNFGNQTCTGLAKSLPC